MHRSSISIHYEPAIIPLLPLSLFAIHLFLGQIWERDFAETSSPLSEMDLPNTASQFKADRSTLSSVLELLLSSPFLALDSSSGRINSIKRTMKHGSRVIFMDGGDRDISPAPLLLCLKAHQCAWNVLINPAFRPMSYRLAALPLGQVYSKIAKTVPQR